MNDRTSDIVVSITFVIFFTFAFIALAKFTINVDIQDVSGTTKNALESHETVTTDIPEVSDTDATTSIVDTSVEITTEVVETAETIVETTIEAEKIEYPKLYSDEDAVALAKMVWGEARGAGDYWTNGRVISGRCQQAATIWTVLNRYDSGFGESIIDVVSAPYQYLGYSPYFPVEDDLLELAYDVLDRWNAEKHGETDVGRVIPADYMWFRGDGRYNYFRNDFNSKTIWDWGLGDPYGG